MLEHRGLALASLNGAGAGDGVDPISSAELVEAAVELPDSPVAVTLHLTAAAEQALQELAIRRAVTTTQIIGEAVLEKKFFSDQRRNGNEVVLRFPDGRLSTVRWPYR
jgi:hypothetical protein